MTRRALGAACYLAGAACLTLALTGYVRGAVARDRARTEWDAAEARRAVRDIEAALDPSRVASAPSRRGAPVARLLIPRLALDEVVVEGVGTAELNAGPGHLPGSPLPGRDGNAVISAHRDRHFHALDRLAVGDTVVTETGAERVTWVIAGRRVVSRSAPAIFGSQSATLTLTTCWPVRYVGPAPDRLLLTARPVGRSPRA